MDLNCLNIKETISTDSVCRLCINYTQSFYTIDHLNGLLEDVLPNLDLTLTSNPVVCSKCTAFITTCSNFKKMCLEKENQIRNYYDITKKTVNLCTMIESEQSCGILYIPKRDHKDISKTSIHPLIKDASIIIEEPQLSFDQSEQSFKYTPNPALDISKNSFKHLFTTSTTTQQYYKNRALSENNSIIVKQELRSTENICENSHRIKEASSENNIVKAIINNLEVPIDSDCDGNNIVEIVESDIASDGDLDLHTDEDLMSFTELCCKGSNDKKNYDALKSEKNPFTFDNNSVGVLLKTIGEPKDNGHVELLISDTQSKDSDMVFIEECNQNGGTNITFKNKSSSEIDLINAELPTISPEKLLKLDDFLMIPNENSKGTKKGNLYTKINSNLFSCTLCHKTFAQKLQVNGHLLTKHKNIANIDKKIDSKIHYCQCCPFRTINNFNLARHMISKHNMTDNAELPTILPDKLLKLEDFLMIPKENSKGTKEVNLYKKIKSNLFSCTLCHKTFTQKVHVEGHLLSKHKNIANIEKKIDSKIHYCQCCLYRTVLFYDLAKHMIGIHNMIENQYKTKSTQFYCAHCKYSTECKGNLGTHLRRHNPVKPFKCQLKNHSKKSHAKNMDNLLRNKVRPKRKVRSPLTPVQT